MESILDIFRDLPGFLEGFIQAYGAWVYGLLFAIIFAETGLVVMPFLPGDSLLFTAGAFAARGATNLWLICVLLVIAAVLGDALNYHAGRWLGPRIFRGESTTGPAKLINRRHLDRAHEFFEKYGGKAVVLARFVPIVRTFVPFVAGAGAMNYGRFALYNVTGAIAWIGVCVGAGYLFGNIPLVQRNFEMVIVGIIVVSLIPIAVELWIARRKKPSSPGSAPRAPDAGT